MTTPANDETKKSDTAATSPATTTPQSAASDAPKKRKRKRKAKKPATTSTTTTSSPTATKNTPHAHKNDDTHKKDSEAKEHTPKESSAEEKEKKSETTKPNLDIKSDTHMLPGIDNIHDYIARKKAPPSHKSAKTEGVDTYTTPDGTELLKLPGLYALVPHAKGDHKLVYKTENVPVGLLDDPRKREKGAMYVKNGRDIYMVTLTMKEHPTLKDVHNEAYDVWIIDTPQQLTDQLEAIKAGMGGGENFGEIIYTDARKAPETDTQNNANTKEDAPEKEQEITTKNNTPEEEHTSKDNLEPVDTDIDDLTEQAEEDGIDAIQLDLPTDDDFPEPDIDSTLADKEDEKKENVNDNGKEAVSTSSEAEIISLDGIEDHDTDTEPEKLSQDDTQEVKEEKPENQENDETEGTSDSISLDIDTTEEGVGQEDETIPIHSVQENVESPSDEGISLDLNSSEEDDASMSHMHFSNPEVSEQKITSPESEESPEEVVEETPGRSLFGPTQTESLNKDTEEVLEVTPQEETGGMFRQPSSTKTDEMTTKSETDEEEPAETVDQPSTPDSPLFPGAHQEVKIEAYGEPETAEKSKETTSTVDVSALNLDDLTINEDQSHDNEPTPSSDQSSDQGSIDLDNVSPPDLEQSVTQNTSAFGVSHSTTTKKGSFPFHIIIRIVLFIIIVGALILVWKIMFPKINGTKSVDTDTPVATGTVVDDTPLDNTGTTGEQDDGDTTIPPEDGTTIPPEDDNQAPGTVNPPEEEVPVADPNQGLTLNELTEKLKLQQTEARKVLNIAKLLENKQAIKFSLAAMLKAGNVLERIDTETTITAEDVLKESEKIDSYLMEASKLVE